jgi:hypothetical protein
MKIKNLTIAFAILCVILLTSRATLAGVDVSKAVDTNKKVWSGSNWILYYNDNKPDGDTGYHDYGESWGTSGYSSSRTDLSCWMASATNILKYQGRISDKEATYTELRNGYVTSPQTNPWSQEIKANNGLGDSYMTWDDGGFQEWVFSSYGVGFERINASIDDIWATDSDNPDWYIDWCVDMLNANHPVGLGIWPASGIGHAITLWGIDTIAQKITITDSDDRTGSDPYVGTKDYFYTYSDNKWKLTDYGSDWYVSYAVIPEPATLALFGLGSLVLLRRRKKGN